MILEVNERTDLDRILEATEAQFEAAVAAEEDAAANDLALSFLQGSTVDLLLRRSAWTLRRPDAVDLPVSEVGADYVRAGSAGTQVVAPLVAATFLQRRGESPRSTEETFVGLLRKQVRGVRELKVACRAGVFRGLPRVVTDSHIALGRSTGDVLIPLSEVLEVELLG